MDQPQPDPLGDAHRLVRDGRAAYDAGDLDTAQAAALLAGCLMQDALLGYLRARDDRWEATRQRWRDEDQAARTLRLAGGLQVREQG